MATRYISISRGSATLAALLVACLTAVPFNARADAVYTFVETSATIDGVPVDAQAEGEIVLTDAAVAAGHASVDEPAPGVFVAHGIVSFTFAAFLSEPVSLGLPHNNQFNIEADVAGKFLNVSMSIAADGGSETYFGSDTILHGTDREGAPCWSHICYVTGYWIDPAPQPAEIPEPSSAWLLLAPLYTIARVLSKAYVGIPT